MSSDTPAKDAPAKAPKPIPYDENTAKKFMGPTRFGGGLPEYLGFDIIESGPGYLIGKMPVDAKLITRYGNMHGGALSAFCDHMLGCVCYPAMKPGQWAATTEFKINLTAPVTKGELTARAELINVGRTQAVVRVDVHNEGRLCAAAQGTITIRDPLEK